MENYFFKIFKENLPIIFSCPNTIQAFKSSKLLTFWNNSAFCCCKYIHILHSVVANIIIFCILLLQIYSYSAFCCCKYIHILHSVVANIFIFCILLLQIYSYSAFCCCKYIHIFPSFPIESSVQTSRGSCMKLQLSKLKMFEYFKRWILSRGLNETNFSEIFFDLI